MIVVVRSWRRLTLTAVVSIEDVCGGDGADIENVDGEEEESAEEIDSPGGKYRDETGQRDEEERHVSDEAGLVKWDCIRVRAHGDANDTDDSAGDEEGAAKDAV